MSPPTSYFAVSILAASALAVPLQPSSPFQGRVVNLARGIKANSPFTNNDDTIFDPSYPQREINRVLEKYRRATKLIDEIGKKLPLGLGDLQDSDSDLDAASASASASANSTSPSSSPDKRDFASEALGAGKSAKTAVMPLMDDRSGNLDVLYYGPIQMGSASQRLTFDIDTGSADLWVPVDCENCPHPGYNAAASSTYQGSQMPFGVTYGSGQVSGTLAQDTVAIGSLSVPGQYFGAVSEESDDFQDSPNDGLIGMAFSTIASSGKPTFFENLISSSKVAQPYFSIHLARGMVRGSQACLGCYDATKATGPVTWVPLTSTTYWAVGMTGAAVNGRNVPIGQGITAAIDTGTTLIYFPQAMAQAFYAAIPGSKQANQYGSGFWTYPCNNPLTVSFSFGGSAFAMNVADFNLGRTGSGSNDCVGGVLALGGNFPNNLVIVGDEFLKSWYSVYDYSHGARVGFAPSVNNKS